MNLKQNKEGQNFRAYCCTGCEHSQTKMAAISRRGFLGTLGGAAALGGMEVMSSKAHAASKKLFQKTDLYLGTPIRVKPTLVYSLPQRKELTSWRPYGGIQSPNDVDAEVKRIDAELKKLSSTADFAMEVLPLAQVTSDAQATAVRDDDCDVILVYAASGEQRWLETIAASNKPKVMFLRHKSGPFYFWYEAAHFWFLRKRGETIQEPNIGIQDIVVDDYGKVLWRLRALYGLKNALGTKVIAIGGLQAYTTLGAEHGPPHAENVWKFEIKQVSSEELDQRLTKAKNDDRTMKEVQRQADEFLAQENVSLLTEKKFVVDSFLITKVFKEIMAEAGATSIGVANCMHKLIPIIGTPPCLVLSLLNDEGYTAFCHCDFTHTPPGILLRYISGKPSFLSNTHYPYDGLMTLAHCAAPRKMNGRDYEPTKIMTHFESDYGAAPKVIFSKGQIITTLIPNFTCTKWIGLRGKIIDSPSYDICRSQIDMEIDGDWRKLLQDIQGFHSVTCYGDYLREVGYALNKLGIAWENISET